MTSAWSITKSVNPPRAAFLDYPLGHTTGRAGHFYEQVAIMRDAVSLFNKIDTPGTIVRLDYEWPEPWKDEARALADHRSERFDTPQYERDTDRDAAIARHGETVACSVCVPSDVPVD